MHLWLFYTTSLPHCTSALATITLGRWHLVLVGGPGQTVPGWVSRSLWNQSADTLMCAVVLQMTQQKLARLMDTSEKSARGLLVETLPTTVHTLNFAQN